ncbi:MAG: MFS transporter [Gemmataceae bacterium]|nr:MFS transporter [Gemmataceae bacterium]
MWGALARLASLWGSQVARVFADSALRLLVVLDYANNGRAELESAWHLVTAILMAPAIILAPFIGALVNSLSKPIVLCGAALFTLLAALVCGFTPLPWLVCWSLVAVGAAISVPVRSALLPAGAEDAAVSLPRVNSLFAAGAGAAALAGVALTLQWSYPAAPVTDNQQIYRWIVAGYFLAMLFALPVRFAADVRRPEPPGRALAGFFRDLGRICREREARWCVLGLAGLRGLITGMTGALLAALVERDGYDLSFMILFGAAVIVGVVVGSLLAGLQKHPRRVLGLVPWGATGLTIGLIVVAAGDVPTRNTCIILGVLAGLVNVPLAATYQAVAPPDARGNAMAVSNCADNVLIAAMSFTLFALAHWAGWGATAELALVAALAGMLALSSWWFLRREVVELLIEGLFLILYRIRAHGPGRTSAPLRGPLLVVSNHACWMDPMLIAKVLPRTVIPMMTSRYFDIPGLRWSMIHLVHAIRVEASTFRRDVPELDEAVRRLDDGRCVVIFPEGWMRRKEELALRHFGQGVWHILRARPQTPVVVCWIEGNWGSYFSYKDGPPTKNKKFDLWRRIDIVVGEPHTLPATVLEDHQATRSELMRECLALRQVLGLEPVPGQAVDQNGTSSAE